MPPVYKLVIERRILVADYIPPAFFALKAYPNYATAHDSATGTNYNVANIEVGQRQDAPTFDRYAIERGLVTFDLASLPVSAKIISAIINLTSYYKYADNPFNLVVVDGTDIDLNDNAYGDLLSRITTLGSIASADIPNSGFDGVAFTITLNSAGRALVAAGAGAGAKVKFGFRSSRDILSTAPGVGQRERCGFKKYIPPTGPVLLKLTITYM